MKKILCGLLFLTFLASLSAQAFAVTCPRLMRTTFSCDSISPLAKPSKASVNIRNVVAGDSVYSTVLIVAQVTGTFSTVVYQIDSGSQYPMSRVGTTNRYQAGWDTTASVGSHTLYVRAKDSGGRVVASASVAVTVVTSYQWELYYEIDYIIGHAPPQVMLDYWQNYWKGHAVKLTYLVDDAVSDPTPSDGYITDSDFWSLESTYNDVWMYDDRSNGGANPQYFLKEKWLLYGTWDTSPNVGGYTYVSLSGNDCQAGNYIFIADSMVDNWEAANGITSEGGDVIVTMHEAGHSIGIAVVSGGGEVYDPDYYSIMSYMRIENGKYMSSYWYYSKEYWTTANKGYYAI